MEMIFKKRDLVWVHLRKERFPHLRKSKLLPRRYRPFKIVKIINDNSYKKKRMMHSWRVMVIFLMNISKRRKPLYLKKAIQSLPTPLSVSDVRSFHRLESLYKHFVKKFSPIAAPLNEILKKNVEFDWKESQERDFQALKDRLTHAPILALPNFTKYFKLECNASNVGIGDYFLKCAHLNYSTYEKELYALVRALQEREFDEDVLSRRHVSLAMLKTSCLEDDDFKDTCELCVNSAKGGFFRHEGFLFKDKRFCIPRSSIRELLVRAAYEGGLMGHFGELNTFKTLNEHFYWPHMRRDVLSNKRFIPFCKTNLNDLAHQESLDLGESSRPNRPIPRPVDSIVQ
ncbi:Retrovirus-related Pol polyprotein from transposon 17.6, partial [Mucuna pruriens]